MLEARGRSRAGHALSRDEPRLEAARAVPGVRAVLGPDGPFTMSGEHVLTADALGGSADCGGGGRYA